MTVSSHRFSCRQALIDELPTIRNLAVDIWWKYYPGIIPDGQIDYMLGRNYALPVLERELREDGIRFFLSLLDGDPVGFAAYGSAPANAEAKLHKLYLQPIHHGRGFGSRLLRAVEADARDSGYARLILQVNKENAKAIATYRRNGYMRRQEIVVDIGGGYVMDDYIYAKAL